MSANPRRRGAWSRIRHRLTYLISCQEATRLLSRLRDGRISFAERCKLRLHLLVCEACRRFKHQLELVREAMRRYRS
jgi:hypothetical protein